MESHTRQGGTSLTNDAAVRDVYLGVNGVLRSAARQAAH